MSDIIWEDPNPPTAPVPHSLRRVSLDEFTRECQQRPGRWAVVWKPRPASSPSRAAVGAVAYVTRGLQVMVGQRSEGDWVMYARWPEDVS